MADPYYQKYIRNVVYSKDSTDIRVVGYVEFIQLLSSGLWFDRDQQKNEGNSDEAKWLLTKHSERFKSRSSDSSEDGGNILRNTYDEQRIYPESREDSIVSGAESSNTNESIGGVVKKRGRPKKSNG